MIQIWQVPSECSPSNLVVLGCSNEGPSFIKKIVLHSRALLASQEGSELKSYLTQTNVLSLRHKKNMLGKSKQEITLTRRKEKGKVLAKNL
jgi:hypothetical protein